MDVRTAFAATLACALAGMLTAGCGSAPAPPAETSSTPTGNLAVRSSAPPLTTSSTAEVSTSRTGARQTAITVLAPPTESAATAAPSPTVTTASAPHTPTPTATVPSTPARSTAPSLATTSAAPTRPGGGGVAGMVVVIDPGHNGANAAHPEIITKQVPAGFGQHKDCNTTGTATNAGYPEYRFNWNVALALRDALQAKGITVVMTRDSDDGVGPCVNQRAAIGNDAHADAVISIHGDGEAAGVHGFYVMTASRPPAGAAMAGQSSTLADDVRTGLLGAGFPVSNTLGHDGIWTRSDLAGLNLSVRPTVMIECGNMRNATEAALMSSADGQHRYATGIAAGVLAYLGVPLGG